MDYGRARISNCGLENPPDPKSEICNRKFEMEVLGGRGAEGHRFARVRAEKRPKQHEPKIISRRWPPAAAAGGFGLDRRAGWARLVLSKLPCSVSKPAGPPDAALRAVMSEGAVCANNPG